MDRSKQVQRNSEPNISKKAVNIKDPDAKRVSKIVWKFGRMVKPKERKWNWADHSTDYLIEIFNKLASFESMTFNELIQTSKNHLIPLSEFDNKLVQKELETLGHSDIGSLFSLHLEGKLRVYCINYVNEFSLLWLDPNHEVYPSKKKHT